jgi:putative membrane protein insertion efficiency factor
MKRAAGRGLPSGVTRSLDIWRAPSILAIGLVGWISQFFRWSGLRSCRFYPTCSAYSKEAFRQFDFFRASSLTAGRILRCHPFCAGGYDPLPEKRV